MVAPLRRQLAARRICRYIRPSSTEPGLRTEKETDSRGAGESAEVSSVLFVKNSPTGSTHISLEKSKKHTALHQGAHIPPVQGRAVPPLWVARSWPELRRAPGTCRKRQRRRPRRWMKSARPSRSTPSAHPGTVRMQVMFWWTTTGTLDQSLRAHPFLKQPPRARRTACSHRLAWATLRRSHRMYRVFLPRRLSLKPGWLQTRSISYLRPYWFMVVHSS